MLRNIAKLIYLDVVVRTSWYPAILGIAVAYISNIGSLTIKTWIAFIASILGMLAIQGLYQHSLDIVHDKGGFSAFRGEAKVSIDQAKRVSKVSLIIAAILAIIIAFTERWWLLLLGVAAVRTAKLYVESHNEFYAVFGFMLSYSVGYFSATNYPALPWLIGLLLVGFVYRASLAMYRLDDYLDGEIPSTYAIIQYYRNIMRYTLHMVPLLTVILLVSITNIKYYVHVLPTYISILAWGLGFGYMGFNMLRYKAKAVLQEAPVWAVALAVMVTDIYSSYTVGDMLNIVKTAFTYSAWWLIFYQFWVSRHAMCNYAKCPVNPFTLMKEKPK